MDVGPTLRWVRRLNVGAAILLAVVFAYAIRCIMVYRGGGFGEDGVDVPGIAVFNAAASLALAVAATWSRPMAKPRSRWDVLANVLLWATAGCMVILATRPESLAGVGNEIYNLSFWMLPGALIIRTTTSARRREFSSLGWEFLVIGFAWWNVNLVLYWFDGYTIGSLLWPLGTISLGAGALVCTTDRKWKFYQGPPISSL